MDSYLLLMLFVHPCPSITGIIANFQLIHHNLPKLRFWWHIRFGAGDDHG